MAKKTADSDTKFKPLATDESNLGTNELSTYIFSVEATEDVMKDTFEELFRKWIESSKDINLFTTGNSDTFLQGSLSLLTKINSIWSLKINSGWPEGIYERRSGAIDYARSASVNAQTFYGGDIGDQINKPSGSQWIGDDPNFSNTSSMIPKAYVGEIADLKTQFSEIRKELEELKDANDKLKDILFTNVAEYGAESTIQLIPVNIYLDTNDSNLIYRTYQSVLDFLTEVGFESSVDFKAEKGSWIKRFIAKSKTAMTSDEVINRLREAEYAVEVNTILKPQSEVEKNQSEAFVGIISSLQGIHHAAIRIGSLIVVKVTTPTGEVSVQTRTLSIEELHIINKHPELLQQPQQVLKALNSYLTGSLPRETQDEPEN